MDPQDQHEWFSSGTGLLIMVRGDLVITFQIPHTALTQDFASIALTRLSGGARSRGQECPRHTGAGQASGRERSSAAARLGRLRIHKNKALLHQGFLIIQDHPMEINERLRIHEYAHVCALEESIALAGLRVKTNVIPQTGTPAPLPAKAQASLFGRDAFFGHRATHLGDGLVGHLDAFGGGLWRRVFDCSRHVLKLPQRLKPPIIWDLTARLKPCPSQTYFASAATGLETSCFFFQSPIAARMASSASTEQWIFTGGSESSFTMSMFLMASASSTVLPFTHSVASEDDAIAEPHPKVLNLASSITLVSRLTLICSFMTSPHSGAPTSPVPTSWLALCLEAGVGGGGVLVDLLCT